MKKTILIEATIETIDDKCCSYHCQFYDEQPFILCSLNDNIEKLKLDDGLCFKRTSVCIEREKVFINKGAK